jgi:hypothetical protein
LSVVGRNAENAEIPSSVCQALPLPVLALALRSEDLQLYSENDTYALVGGWVGSQPESERKSAFDRLVRCLRFHHMSGDFLANVVGRSKYRSGCMYLVDACLRALAYQSMCESSINEVHPQHPLASCKPSRAPAEPPLHTFEVQVELVRLLSMDTDHDIRLGIAGGYKLIVEMGRREDPEEEGAPATVGLFVRFGRPGTLNADDGEDEEEDDDDDETVSLVGPFVAVRISAGRQVRVLQNAYDEGDSSWGYSDFFDAPWGEVVQGHSVHFPGGRMTLKVEVQFLSDRHDSTIWPSWW